MTTASTPLVGREQELALALAVLTSTRRGGLLVHGPRGVGKTSLARTIAASQGEPPHWVHADRVLRRFPYGALAPLLDQDLSRPSGTDPAGLRRAVVRALTAPGTERPVVAVDDADQLDVPSSTVLSQLSMTGQIRLVVVSRRHPSVSEQFGSLVHDGVLTALELCPLRDDEIRSLLQERLGGSVPGTVAEFFVRRCDGNPRVLDAWLTAAQDQGVIVSRSGVWLLTGLPLRPSPLLRDIGEHFSAEMDSTTRTAADLIALTEELPVQDALAMGLGEGVDRLIHDGVCTVTAHRPPGVRFTSRATMELHRATISRGHGMVLRTGIGRGIDLSGHPLAPRAAWILWSLDSGVELPRSLLVETAREAMRSSRPQFAHAVLCSIGSEQLEPEQQLDLATALCDVNRALLASDLLLQALPHITAPAGMDRSALVWSRILLRLDTPVEDLESSVEQWRRLVGGPDPSPEQREHRDVLAIRLLDALAPPSRTLTDPARPEKATAGPGPSATQALALITLSGHHAARGHHDLAHALAARVIVDDGTCENAADLHRLLVRAHPSPPVPLPTAPARLSAEFCDDTAHLAQETGPVEFERGRDALRAGDVAEALRALRIAVEALTLWDDRQLLPSALSTAAYAAALLPDSSVTDDQLRRLRELDRRGTIERQLLTRATEAAARRIRHRGEDDPHELRELAQQARAVQSLSVEAQIHLLAVAAGELGTIQDMERPEPLPPLLTDGRVLVAYRIGAALRSGDSAELIRLAAVMQSSPSAVRTLAEEAKRLAQLSGDPAELAGAAALLRSTGAPAGGRLSRREQEVAEGILEGLSNAEIAERLGVTTRTVEGHVYRLYRRLGISARHELTAKHLEPPAQDSPPPPAP